MTLTGIMMTWIFAIRGQQGKTALALFVTLVDRFIEISGLSFFALLTKEKLIVPALL